MLHGFRWKLRKSLTKMSQDFKFGAVRRDVNLVDLENCWKMSTKFLVKIGVDTDENEPSEILVAGTCSYRRASTGGLVPERCKEPLLMQLRVETPNRWTLPKFERMCSLNCWQWAGKLENTRTQTGPQNMKRTGPHWNTWRTWTYARA